MLAGSLFLTAGALSVQAQVCGGGGIGYGAYPVYAAPAAVAVAPVAPPIVYSPSVVYQPSVVYSFDYGGRGYSPGYRVVPRHWSAGVGYHGRSYSGGSHYGGYRGGHYGGVYFNGWH